MQNCSWVSGDGKLLLMFTFTFIFDDQLKLRLVNDTFFISNQNKLYLSECLLWSETYIIALYSVTLIKIILCKRAGLMLLSIKSRAQRHKNYKLWFPFIRRWEIFKRYSDYAWSPSRNLLENLLEVCSSFIYPGKLSSNNALQFAM